MHKVSFPIDIVYLWFSSPQLSRHVPTCLAVASHHSNRLSCSGLLATCTTTRGVAALNVRASAEHVLLLCQCTVRVPRRGIYSIT